MSSKVLVENSPERARPFAWRTVTPAGETLERRGAAASKIASITVPMQALEERIAELEQAAEVRAREAQQIGFREGEAAARVGAEDGVRAAIERLAKSISDLGEYRSHIYQQAEVDAVRLSIAIARRILRRELTVDPAAIEGLVRTALERLQAQDPCRVRVHPDHVPALHAAIERMGMSAKVEVLADPAQELGAAVFEMTRGNLDASIDSQLREIERGLVDRVQRS
jgi:flagellar assembly protein FliH